MYATLDGPHFRIINAREQERFRHDIGVALILDLSMRVTLLDLTLNLLKRLCLTFRPHLLPPLPMQVSRGNFCLGGLAGIINHAQIIVFILFIVVILIDHGHIVNKGIALDFRLVCWCQYHCEQTVKRVS